MAFPIAICSAPSQINQKSTLETKTKEQKRKALKLTAKKVSGKTIYCKKFQAKQPTLCQNLGEEEQFQITNRLGKGLLPGVVRYELIHFVVA